MIDFGRGPVGEHEEGPPDRLAEILGVGNAQMRNAYMVAAEEIDNHAKPHPNGHMIGGARDPPETCPRCVTARNLRREVDFLCQAIESCEPRPGTAARRAWFQAALASLNAFAAGMHFGRMVEPFIERAVAAGWGSVEAGDKRGPVAAAEADARATARFPEGVAPDLPLTDQAVRAADLPDKTVGRARGFEESARRLAPGPLPDRVCEAVGCGETFTPRARGDRFCCPACRKRQNARDARARNGRPK